ncbi:MAG: hypothetical protein IKM82_04930 [Oscillospiraceae bacterium]|nr:hypothetical protein [Oscillospiraceae bacterium]MBR7074768.1 hypothetical protein [Oscillospiraceae bacterium]
MKIILIRQAEGDSLPENTKKGNAAAYRFYTGTEPESIATAQALFTFGGEPIRSPLLDNIPVQAGFRGKLKAHRDARRRAGAFLDELEKEERDSVVICGRQAMSALRSVLRTRGYLLEGGSLVLRPLERVRATRRSLHCGGCAHNCLLSEAKCEKGRSKARGIL